MISITGEPGSRGVRNGVSIADMSPACGRLWHHERPAVKEKTGKGNTPMSPCSKASLPVTGNYRAYMPTECSPSPWAQRTRPCSLPDLPYQTKDLAGFFPRVAVTNSGGSFPHPRSERCWTTRACHKRRPGPEPRYPHRKAPRSLFNEDLRGMGGTLLAQGIPMGLSTD